ncbi:dihydrofolate reductase family protein [Neobacillus sp. YX16]|uniref:dihydrofolate reductase family protein n=1 Tax=Neobacillus sp. YX16 TaxID=3047874 RepID=UPI0024C30036|nr:dihydrofolate reductase family protein [Neobacillus sp. YX16]WHZ02871.1 dihydrofolate reductase family protein [Neobacillus sp. YX16]
MSNQSKLVFYGAISLDGYLARENHELDWLFGTEGEEETGYQEFYESVDIILMGRNTYDQISILSPDKFPYEGKPCYVFSRTLTGSIEHVTFINEDIVGFTQSLKEQEGKRIWIVGGGDVLQHLLQAKIVDEFIIQIAPTIIGRGIPLFVEGDRENELTLVDVRRYKQFAELQYQVK